MAEINIIGETRNMFIVEIKLGEDETGITKTRVPKDPNRIPNNSIYIFKKGKIVDLTKEVKKMVEAKLKKKGGE